MRLAVLALVLINALVLAFGLRGGFARLDPRGPGAGPDIAPMPAPAQAGPTLVLLHERAPAPGPLRPQIPRPPTPDSPPAPEPAADAHAPAVVPTDPPSLDAPGPHESQASAAEPQAVPAAPQPAQPAPSPAESIQAPAPAVTTDKSALAHADACMVAGPFDARADAARMRFEAAAKEAGARLLERETRPSGPVRQWVVLEGFANEPAARAALDRLRAAGFADLAPVQSADGWVVSLGIFGQASRARQHRDTVRAAGFEAVLRERASGPTREWMRFAVPAGVETDALRAALGGGAVLAACPSGEG